MLPLRGFQLVSDVLNYNGGVTANVSFSTKTQNFTRAAIIAMTVYAVATVDLLRTLLKRFDVAGRPYKQGDDFIIGMLASGRVPIIGGTQEDNKRSVFPGQTIPLSDGTYCSGIMLNGREEITIQVEKLVAGAGALSNIVLHCVEFPRGAYPIAIQAKIDQLWDRFRAGIGQFHCVGNTFATVAGAANQQVLEALVNPPHTMNARRTEVRGNENVTATGADNETEFAGATVQAYGQTSTRTSNAGVPARQLVGHANLHYTDQVGADFERDSRSLLLVNHPVAVANSNVRFATLFEGVPEGVKLCGPSVF